MPILNAGSWGEGRFLRSLSTATGEAKAPGHPATGGRPSLAGRAASQPEGCEASPRGARRILRVPSVLAGFGSRSAHAIPQPKAIPQAKTTEAPVTSNGEATHATVESSLSISLVSSQGAGDAVAVEAVAQQAPPHSATAAPMAEVTP
jgi:hypothetical protein